MKKSWNAILLQFSLGQKFLIILGFFLALGAVVNGFQFFRVLDMVVETEVKSLQTSARILGNSISAQFYERYGDVQAFSKNQVFSKGTKEDMVQALNQYSHLYGIYDLISFVDTKGKLIAINNKDAMGKPIPSESLYHENLDSEKWFKLIQNNQYLEDKGKKFTGTVYGDFSLDTFASAIFKKDIYSTIFVAPVFHSSGKILGYICNHANSKWIENEIELAYKQMSLLGHPTARLTLLNKKGEILVLANEKYETKTMSLLNRNRDVVLKGNWRDLKYFPALALRQGKSGFGLTTDPQNKMDVYVGYSPIRSDKFIDEIGWSVVVEIPKKDYLTHVQKAAIEFLTSLLGILIISLIFSYWFVRGNKIKLDLVSQDLKRVVEKTAVLGRDVAFSSQTVENSISSNQSAIQQSVSALAEMRSMMAQTNVNAKCSLEKTEKAKQCSLNGKYTMERMAHSMNAIHESNGDLQAISELIENIHQKTNIINDIAFKTQILSFNASIESARAGQHGRGFGVVAQEVGKLADVSAASAAEIKALIVESIQKVNSTLEAIQSRLADGNKVSNEAIDVFGQISSYVDEISIQVRAIKEASDQQERGIIQANQAMRDIDQASQKNNQAAMGSRIASQNLLQQSHQLEVVVSDLTSVVQGQNPIKEKVSLKEGDLPLAGEFPRGA